MNIKNVYDKNISLYVSGIVKMASNVSDKIGLSYMDADCFKKGNIKDIISKYYNIPIDKINIQEIDISLEKLFIDVFGEEKKLIEGLMYLLKVDLGDVKKIYTLNDEIIDLLKAPNSSFYFVEDAYIIEFEKNIVIFIIGNNE